MILVVAALGGCSKSRVTTEVVEAGVTPAASASAKRTIDPASREAPPLVAIPSAPPKNIPRYKIDFKEDVELEGVYESSSATEAPEKDSATCVGALTLSSPIRVVNDNGGDADPRPKPGGTTRVCLMNWKDPEPWSGAAMLQRDSYVKVKGHVSSPIRSHHPRSILVFDTVLVAAAPPSTTAPPGRFLDGESFVYVRKVNVAARTLSFDLAYLYYGEDAKRMAASRGKTLPAGRNWFVVNDSNQLRTLTLPEKVYPLGLDEDPGGGWRSIKLDDLSRDAERGGDADPNLAPSATSRPFFLNLKDGEVYDSVTGSYAMRRVNLK